MAVVFLAIPIVSVLQGFLQGMERIEIIAALPGADDESAIRGLTVFEGRPYEAEVWGIAKDATGNQYPVSGAIYGSGVVPANTGATNTAPPGRFELPLPAPFTSDALPASVILFAIGPEDDKGAAVPSGQVVLRPDVMTGFRSRSKSLSPSLAIFTLISIVCFGCGLIIALIHSVDIKWRYYFSLGFAILLVMSMCGTLMLSMAYFANRGAPGDIFNFGFAQVFYGSHTSEIPSEWMVSLTTPQPKADGVVTGFFAPLWVMLVAVIGASLMTLSLLVADIVKPVTVDSDDKILRKRIQSIVMHQFFIVFAPLGAIFVYQSLLAAKAAEEPIAVATAALGAGVAINVILKSAVNAAKNLFASDEK